MQAVILATDGGSRVQSLSDVLPKPMLPVADRPLVEHVASAATAAGADELFVVGCTAIDAVRNHFGSTFRKRPVSYVTADGGVLDAVRAVAPRLDGDFALLDSGVLYERSDVVALFDAGPGIVAADRSDSRGPDASATADRRTRRDHHTTNYELDHDDRVLLSTGAFVFPAETSAYLGASGEGISDFATLLEQTIRDYDVTVVEPSRWTAVRYPWDLLSANEWKLAELDPYVEGSVSERACVDGDVVVEAGATVAEGVFVEGPALIRSGAHVGPNAYVRGATLLDADVSVGRAAEVKNSVVMEGSTVNHLSYVGDSVLGPEVDLGAGTHVANLRHDGEPVELTVRGESSSTGRRKFGAIVGHGATTESHTNLDPGVALSPATTTDRGERVRGNR